MKTPAFLLAPIAFIALSSSACVYSYEFTTYDLPGVTETNIIDINNQGKIVGLYNTVTHDGIHSFFYDWVSSGAVDLPGSVGRINNADQIVGSYGHPSQGYLYEEGEFGSIQVPGGNWTTASGINDHGDIVGSYNPPPEIKGYLLHDGVVDSFSVPGAIETYPQDVNNNGVIVGYCYTSSGARGFFFDGQDFTNIHYPGAAYTQAWGINNLGQVVGSYLLNESGYGFLWENGVFTSIEFPGSTWTTIHGINDFGTMVGRYERGHGFVASPVPIPSAAILLLPSLGLFAWIRRKDNR